MASGAVSPCGACKFLRRKCASDCIFAPYFNSDQGPARFAAIHKIFGASNVSKLMLHLPLPDRCEAVVTIAYEAQARIRDPVYGCVAHIFALQQQVAILQAQLMQLEAQLAHSIAGSQGDQEQGNIAHPLVQSYSNMQTVYPKRSFDRVDYSSDGLAMQEMGFKEDLPTHYCTKTRAPYNELGELQTLALRMMGS